MTGSLMTNPWRGLQKSLLLAVFAFGASLDLVAQNFTFSGNSMNSIIAQGREKTVLRGNAEIISDSTLISAQEIELYGREFRYALSRGDVTVTDKNKGIVLKAQELFFDRDKKISRVNGAAVLEDQKNEMIVKGGFFENRDQDDIIIIQIGVRILKKDMACRSEYARFNRKNDTLELSGLPIVVWKGDEYKANRITINVKTNEIQLDGRVSGKVTQEKDQEEKPAETAAPEKTPEVPEKAPEEGAQPVEKPQPQTVPAPPVEEPPKEPQSRENK